LKYFTVKTLVAFVFLPVLLAPQPTRAQTRYRQDTGRNLLKSKIETGISQGNGLFKFNNADS